MANHLAAIGRSSYCMAENNALRVYESYSPEKIIMVDINRLTASYTLFYTQNNVHTCT